jgi:hypothetical protein
MSISLKKPRRNPEEIRANTRPGRWPSFVSSVVAVVRMTAFRHPVVRSRCQYQGCWSLFFVVVVVVVVVVGVKAHLRFMLEILIFDITPFGRVKVIRIEDAAILPVRIVQTCWFVAAAVTTRTGAKDMKRVWRGARESVKTTSPVRALVTRFSHRWRSRMGSTVPWDEDGVSLRNEVFAVFSWWEVEVTVLLAAASTRACRLSSRGGIELSVHMMGLSLCGSNGGVGMPASETG